MKVLVIDDHQTVRQMATKLLACLGHTPLEARDAAEAEATLDRHPDQVDVVLMDLCLDGTDGGALARRLQSSRSELRILFMSGDGEDVFAARDLAGPRRGFIEKPFSLKGLSVALEGLLTR
ncbi:MAG TPA: response regulator [Polyangia bacterium]|nr:response regulator [Polyangia bacterium]